MIFIAKRIEETRRSVIPQRGGRLEGIVACLQGQSRKGLGNEHAALVGLTHPDLGSEAIEQVLSELAVVHTSIRGVIDAQLESIKLVLHTIDVHTQVVLLPSQVLAQVQNALFAQHLLRQLHTVGHRGEAQNVAHDVLLCILRQAHIAAHQVEVIHAVGVGNHAQILLVLLSLRDDEVAQLQRADQLGGHRDHAVTEVVLELHLADDLQLLVVVDTHQDGRDRRHDLRAVILHRRGAIEVGHALGRDFFSLIGRRRLTQSSRVHGGRDRDGNRWGHSVVWGRDDSSGPNWDVRSIIHRGICGACLFNSDHIL